MRRSTFPRKEYQVSPLSIVSTTWELSDSINYDSQTFVLQYIFSSVEYIFVILEILSNKCHIINQIIIHFIGQSTKAKKYLSFKFTANDEDTIPNLAAHRAYVERGQLTPYIFPLSQRHQRQQETVISALLQQ